MADPLVFMLPLLCGVMRNLSKRLLRRRPQGVKDEPACWPNNLMLFARRAARALPPPFARDRRIGILRGRQDRRWHIAVARLSYFRSASAKSFKIAGYKKIPGNPRNIRARCFQFLATLTTPGKTDTQQVLAGVLRG
jgi:hypothetical protein